MLDQILEFLAPARCQICSELVTSTPELLSGNESAKLAQQLFCCHCRPRDFLHSQTSDPSSYLAKALGLSCCSICGELTAAASTSCCPVCSAFSLNVDKLASIACYEANLKSSIRMLKYGNAWPLVPYFSSLLVEKLKTLIPSLGLNDSRILKPRPLVIPIPSSASTIRTRGYAHVELIARRTANALGFRAVTSVLKTAKKRPAQASIPVRDRARNSVGAFTAVKDFRDNPSIILIDDVITTGATISAAASVLRSAGACAIVAVSIAKVPAFQHHRVEANLGRLQFSKNRSPR